MDFTLACSYFIFLYFTFILIVKKGQYTYIIRGEQDYKVQSEREAPQ